MGVIHSCTARYSAIPKRAWHGQLSIKPLIQLVQESALAVVGVPFQGCNEVLQRQRAPLSLLRLLQGRRSHTPLCGGGTCAMPAYDIYVWYLHGGMGMSILLLRLREDHELSMTDIRVREDSQTQKRR